MSNQSIDAPALDQLFAAARTHNQWQDKALAKEKITALYELLKWGPTSANCSPARFVFITSDAAKERLKPALDKGNLEKTMSAPAIAIVAHDLAFYEHLPELFPHADAKSWFAGNDKKIQETAFRNGTLQGAYLILAARALGIDCGPMSGFSSEKVDVEFFSGTQIKSNFLVNLGFGNPDGLHPRGPRLSFEQACEML